MAGKKKTYIKTVEGVGAIEQVGEYDNSFNVFQYIRTITTAQKGDYTFYKSAYKLETAMRYLKELEVSLGG